MKKHVLIGSTLDGHAYATIAWDGKRLSITGVIGPLANGDARGGCGQIASLLREYSERGALVPSLTAEDVSRLLDVWDRWHLNDMRAGCEHQRAANWRMCPGHPSRPDEWERADFECELFTRPAMRRTLTNCAGETETVTIQDRSFAPGKYYPHYDRCSCDMLSKPCPTCGYKYGTAWLHEDVPADVIAFLEALPETDKLPACWKR